MAGAEKTKKRLENPISFTVVDVNRLELLTLRTSSDCSTS